MSVDEEEVLPTLTSGFTIFQNACESKDKLRHTLVENFLNQAKIGRRGKACQNPYHRFSAVFLGFQRRGDLEELGSSEMKIVKVKIVCALMF